MRARHKRALLPVADARHVDGCLRVARLADHRDAGRKFPRHPSRLDWKVPAGFTQIAAPTPYVWIIGRTKTDGPPDYAAVNKIQAGLKITPLSEWGKAPTPVEAKIDPRWT